MAKGCKTKVVREMRGSGWTLWILATPDFPMTSRVGRTFKTRKQAQEFAREWCRKRGY